MVPKQVSEGAHCSERAYPVASGREPHESAPCRFRFGKVSWVPSAVSLCRPSDALAQGERRDRKSEGFFSGLLQAVQP
ncbi:hypothetical protein LEMLEM_LOCUS16324 [Lemmus lemmus]